MKALFEYLDYREYLADFYKEHKEANSLYSYRLLGRKLGIDPSFLFRVMQGKAHFSPEQVAPISDYCNLTTREREFFELLVDFGRAKGDQNRRAIFERLMSFRKTPAIRLIHQKYTYFANWYHAVIRSLIGIRKYSTDVKKIAQSLSPEISIKEVRESIELQKKLKLVVEGADGVLLPTEMHVTTGKEFRSLAVRAYQRENIRLGDEAIERHEPSVRDISSMTVCLDAESFEDIRDYIEEFRSQILSRVDSVKNPDQVYQFNIQLFPVTKKQAAQEVRNKEITCES